MTYRSFQRTRARSTVWLSRTLSAVRPSSLVHSVSNHSQNTSRRIAQSIYTVVLDAGARELRHLRRQRRLGQPRSFRPEKFISSDVYISSIPILYSSLCPASFGRERVKRRRVSLVRELIADGGGVRERARAARGPDGRSVQGRERRSRVCPRAHFGNEYTLQRKKDTRDTWRLLTVFGRCLCRRRRFARARAPRVEPAVAPPRRQTCDAYVRFRKVTHGYTCCPTGFRLFHKSQKASLSLSLSLVCLARFDAYSASVRRWVSCCLMRLDSSRVSTFFCSSREIDSLSSVAGESAAAPPPTAAWPPPAGANASGASVDSNRRRGV